MTDHELEGEGPSLRDIARQLTTPSLSGMVLTRDRIGGIATRLSLPVGFSERQQMIVNMFRAAGELQSVSALIDALGVEVKRWESQYAAWSDEYPASRSVWDEWQARLARSRELLSSMAAEVSTPEQPPPDQ